MTGTDDFFRVAYVYARGLTGIAIGAGGGCLDMFSLVYYFSFLSPSLWMRPNTD